MGFIGRIVAEYTTSSGIATEAHSLTPAGSCSPIDSNVLDRDGGSRGSAGSPAAALSSVPQTGRQDLQRHPDPEPSTSCAESFDAALSRDHVLGRERAEPSPARDDRDSGVELQRLLLLNRGPRTGSPGRDPGPRERRRARTDGQDGLPSGIPEPGRPGHSRFRPQAHLDSRRDVRCRRPGPARAGPRRRRDP